MIKVLLSTLLQQQQELWSKRFERCKKLGLAEAIVTTLYIDAAEKLTPYNGRSREKLEKMNRKLRAADKKLINCVADVTMPLVSEKARVLEIGCGPGNLLLRLLPIIVDEAGGDYRAIDFCQKYVNLARRQVRQVLKRSDVKCITYGFAHELTGNSHGRHPPFAEESLQIVIFGRVGLHIVDDQDWEETLCQIGSVIAPGGYLVLYEALADDNFRFTPSGKFRRLSQYEDVLAEKGLKRMAVRKCRFMNEIDTIVTFQKTATARR